MDAKHDDEVAASGGTVKWRVFEFFSGIGGLRAGWDRAVDIFNRSGVRTLDAAGRHALQAGAVVGRLPHPAHHFLSPSPATQDRHGVTPLRLHASVCRAYDVSATANAVYAHNFGIAPLALSLEHLPFSSLGRVRAEAPRSAEQGPRRQTATSRAEGDGCDAAANGLTPPPTLRGEPGDLRNEETEAEKTGARGRGKADATAAPSAVAATQGACELPAGGARELSNERQPRSPAPFRAGAGEFFREAASAKPRREAHVWLLSPPCQPYTRGGKREDSRDPRAKSILHLLACLESLADPPKMLFVENVRGFEASETHARLREALRNQGYRVEEFLLSPTQLGFPNTRVRYYCLAWRPPQATKPSDARSPTRDAASADAGRGDALSPRENRADSGETGDQPHDRDHTHLYVSPPEEALRLWCDASGVALLPLKPESPLPDEAGHAPRSKASPPRFADASISSHVVLSPSGGAGQASLASSSPKASVSYSTLSRRQPVARRIGDFLDASLSPEALAALRVPPAKLKKFVAFAQANCTHACSAAKPPRASSHAPRKGEKRHKRGGRPGDSRLPEGDSNGEAKHRGDDAKVEAESGEATSPGAEQGAREEREERGKRAAEAGESLEAVGSRGKADCPCVCCQEGKCRCEEFAFRLDIVTPQSVASSTFTKGYATNLHTGGPLLLVEAASPTSSPSPFPPSSSANAAPSESSSESPSVPPPPGSALRPRAADGASARLLGDAYEHIFATEALDASRFLHRLDEGDFIRFFSSSELLRLHGYPPSFAFPPALANKKAASLVGNSVNVSVIAVLLLHLLLQFFAPDAAQEGAKQGRREHGNAENI
ncbi:hypothetical protein BESB_059190 [Besnoitia besnoiti]|uniref:DNA methyltransferase 2 n=1 Tax=Besnoitia besnoiti TaxID=94643 RepID=A0A2A9MI06_BESBE|nr:hypothetical protein BESB_059190 [Besnoitia besnoiti]PFH35032.1 hypothetical protein BESB_059190 [Besnoitia besnoiti]